jgi:hypothetical protein
MSGIVSEAASESPIIQVTMPQVEIPTELCRIVVKFFEFQLNSS